MSRNPFHAVEPFRGFRFAHLLRPASLLAPLVRIRPVSQPSGTFTSRLPAVRSPSPPLDMTTAAAGPLCWRDSHPLERQLASLHDLSGSQAIHPVPLPRSRTPAGPTLPRHESGRVDAAPAPFESKGSSENSISRLTAGLWHLLSTLHERCCHRPCKTRFRPAGWPLPGGRRTLWTAMKGFRLLHLFPLSWVYPDATTGPSQPRKR